VPPTESQAAVADKLPGQQKIGGDIGISAMCADDVCNAALVAGNGFVGADVATASNRKFR